MSQATFRVPFAGSEDEEHGGERGDEERGGEEMKNVKLIIKYRSLPKALACRIPEPLADDQGKRRIVFQDTKSEVCYRKMRREEKKKKKRKQHVSWRRWHSEKKLCSDIVLRWPLYHSTRKPW